MILYVYNIYLINIYIISQSLIKYSKRQLLRGKCRIAFSISCRLLLTKYFDMLNIYNGIDYHLKLIII